MRAFATLLDRLTLTPARTGKLTLLTDYFRATPDPDRGWALAALTGGLDLRTVKPALLRSLVEARTDPELFRLSYDYVGDLAETISLIWEPRGTLRDLTLAEVVDRLATLSRTEAGAEVERLLDSLDPPRRYALIKLATGGLRVGASARLVKQALGTLGDQPAEAIEELWHGLVPPYGDLFAWLTAGAPRPDRAAAAPFRPVMLATALEDADRARIDPAAYAAEWKWDGIRVQAVAERGVRRLYTRTGEDISGAFPDLVAALAFDGALDGELLVGRPGLEGIAIGAFADLQQRLNRKSVSPALMRSHPAVMRVYDILTWGGIDHRPLPYTDRRAALIRALAALDPARFDLSPDVPFTGWDDLATLRGTPPHPMVEGLMLKRRDSPYVAGRPKGPWFKWKRDPFLIDAVLMYAQRGHGKRSSFYSDYTFGVWAPDGSLVPVGKAYFGFTDDELRQIDGWVRANTTDRFGPVRAVRATPEAGLVVEVAFEGLNRSTRHRSGVAMRFPRIHRLRWDKPPAEADRIETLEALLATL